MIDLILALILVGILGSAIRYIIKAKKSGVKCIGCSVEGGCAKKNSKTTGCGSDTEKW